MVFAAIVFLLSFVCIVGLFSLKVWETRSGRVLAPAFRMRADARAVELKELALAARNDLDKLWPATVRLAHFLLHEAVLAFAALAHYASRQAYRLADMVSHKRGFERRETRSEFLKKVAEHKSATAVDSQEEGKLQ